MGTAVHQKHDYPKDRGDLNFDFRIASLLLIAITRPALLEEYRQHGAEAPTLRKLGLPPDILSEMLELFRREEVKPALITMQRLTRTMVAYLEYCDLGCWDDDFYERLVPLTAGLKGRLKRAGVEVERGEGYA